MNILTKQARPVKVMDTDEQGVVFYRDPTEDEFMYIASSYLPDPWRIFDKSVAESERLT